jgi:hypothetical protein
MVVHFLQCAYVPTSTVLVRVQHGKRTDGLGTFPTETVFDSFDLSHVTYFLVSSFRVSIIQSFVFSVAVIVPLLSS